MTGGNAIASFRGNLPLLLGSVKSGDWVVFLAAVVVVIWLFFSLWRGGTGGTVVIRAGGKVVTEASLARNRMISVQGPLGTSIIDIRDHRVRVASDPGPHQYCVKQGWLSRAGEAAICLPNQVSVEIEGTRRLYDTLNY